jgi:GNAT superfamily N-acetyltransferase
LTPVALTAVADDRIATVVTTLEMRQRPPLRPTPASPLRLVRWDRPSAARYRALFTRIGAPWLWFSRLALSEEALLAIIHASTTEIYVVADPAGIEVGMLELDLGTSGECTLAYFGLIPELAGQGHGRWLMAEALTRAWRGGVTRVVVNTCTLDHPSALNFYRAQGFTATSRTVETFVDPRLSGLLPPDAAPQIPCLDSRRQATIATSASATS